MKQLIIKDFMVLRFINLLIIFMGILFGFIGAISTIPFSANMIYGYGIFVMIYMFLMFSLQIEEKSKSYIMVSSFPLNREKIVTAKYISIIIYLIVSALFIILVSNISIRLFTVTLSENTPSIFSLLFIIGICLLFLSVYLPFQYYYMAKSQMFNSLFYGILILLPNILSRYGFRIENIKWINSLVKIDLKNIIFIVLGIGILMYLISLKVSQKIYKAKEFY